MVTGIVGFLLISFASAGLVDFLSNSVSGTIEVQGPVFYTSASNELVMNDNSDLSDATYQIDDTDNERFWMAEGLGGIDYNWDKVINFYVNARVNNETPAKSLKVEFGYSDMNHVSHEICDTIILNGIYEEYPDDPIEASCQSDGDVVNADKFYFKVIGQGDDSIKYYLNTDGTYVEMTGVYDE